MTSNRSADTRGIARVRGGSHDGDARAKLRPRLARAALRAERAKVRQKELRAKRAQIRF
jgi:hypothetical protein